MRPLHRAALPWLATTLVACASQPPARTAASSPPKVDAKPPADADPMKTPGTASPLVWAEFSPETFARAKAEHRFIVFDGAAEWCHWCHVMEATTYRDPAVQKRLAERFLAVKVDIDTRPDLAERYGDYGWPATVIFGPEGDERGKYRGYLAPEDFLQILEQVTEAPASVQGAREETAETTPLPPGVLPWVSRFAEAELDDYYDDEQGGWGRGQKAPIEADNAWALGRARAGDARARSRVLATLEKQAALIDPVWGGIYQYSAARDWVHPHFEKLMTYQAGALDNYATAFALTQDPTLLAHAKAIRSYLEAFLSAPDGGFYATQDADLHAHEADQARFPFVDGHVYYAQDDAHRRALGIPRVDVHEYGKENGLAIAAYVAFFEATKDVTALARAERAADHILETHQVTSGDVSGGIRHDASEGAPASSVLYLADNAAFGLALARLAEATGKPERRAQAVHLADLVCQAFTDVAHPKAGGFYAHTKDPDAVGVFAARRKPFEENVMAVRFLVRVMGLLAKERSPAARTAYARYEHAVGLALPGLSEPSALKRRGRFLGDFLLATDEWRGLHHD